MCRVADLLGFLDFEINQLLQCGLERLEIIVRSRLSPDHCRQILGLCDPCDKIRRLFHCCVVLAAGDANQAGFVRIERRTPHFAQCFFEQTRSGIAGEQFVTQAPDRRYLVGAGDAARRRHIHLLIPG